VKTLSDALQEIKARIPTSRLLKAPREVNRESIGYTLVDDVGLVLEVFHADSPALERQWAAFLRRAAKDMKWVCDELEFAWQQNERWRQRRRDGAADPLSALLTELPQSSP
jgi:hypothetical protein